MARNSFLVPAIAHRRLVRPPVSLVPDAVNIASSTYLLAGSDLGKILDFSTACTVTVPSFTFNSQDQLLFLQSGTGAVTFVGESGVAINVYPSGSAAIPGQWQFSVLRFISPNVCVFSKLLPLQSIAAWTTIIEDDGSGTASITNRTPDTISAGTLWQNGTAATLSAYTTYFSATDQAAANSEFYGVIAYTPSPPIRITQSIQWRAAATGVIVGIIFNYVDSLNFFELTHTRGGNVSLRQVLAGAIQAPLATAALGTHAQNTTFEMQLEISATTIIYKFAGTTRITHSGSFAGINKIAGFRTRAALDRVLSWKLEAFI